LQNCIYLLLLNSTTIFTVKKIYNAIESFQKIKKFSIAKLSANWIWKKDTLQNYSSLLRSLIYNLLNNNHKICLYILKSNFKTIQNAPELLKNK
jgi:hypothetical protein